MIVENTEQKLLRLFDFNVIVACPTAGKTTLVRTVDKPDVLWDVDNLIGDAYGWEDLQQAHVWFKDTYNALYEDIMSAFASMTSWIAIHSGKAITILQFVPITLPSTASVLYVTRSVDSFISHWKIRGTDISKEEAEKNLAWYRDAALDGHHPFVVLEEDEGLCDIFRLTPNLEQSDDNPGRGKRIEGQTLYKFLNKNE